MHQPDSERAATEHTVGKHTDDFSGVEVAGVVTPGPVPHAMRLDDGFFSC